MKDKDLFKWFDAIRDHPITEMLAGKTYVYCPTCDEIVPLERSVVPVEIADVDDPRLGDVLKDRGAWSGPGSCRQGLEA